MVAGGLSGYTQIASQMHAFSTQKLLKFIYMHTYIADFGYVSACIFVVCVEEIYLVAARKIHSQKMRCFISFI